MIPYQRIIGRILVTDSFPSYKGSCVSVISRAFSEYLPVASPVSLARILDAQVIDEIQLSWIGGLSRNSLDIFLDLVRTISSHISVPLSVSCRIADFDLACRLFDSGADKIILGRNLFSSSSFLSRIVSTYGAQAVVGSLDYRIVGDSLVLLNSTNSVFKLSSLALVINSMGIGEVSFNSVDNDGSSSSHPLFSIVDLSEINIPVLVSGGYRRHSQISDAFSASVNGVVLSSFLAKSDQSVQQIKARLINDGYRLRLY